MTVGPYLDDRVKRIFKDELKGVNAHAYHLIKNE